MRHTHSYVDIVLDWKNFFINLFVISHPSEKLPQQDLHLIISNQLATMLTSLLNRMEIYGLFWR